MLFFDTSELVKRYAEEDGTDVVDELIEEADEGRHAISAVTVDDYVRTGCFETIERSPPQNVFTEYTRTGQYGLTPPRRPLDPGDRCGDAGRPPSQCRLPVRIAGSRRGARPE
ncbi:nucleotidyltransferase domain protein [Halalkaliarchaeum desulfuricum]|uniref:Nucleotidyltransferase domain protein n=1 Tax=Halalkaliarchaeum desulfuricum TaxID=2055893 RepID=A0A343TN53_9EURY|nr:nucleotidyltransferase domain protein [Halalkaliarchaeum desulfuricum]